MGWVGLGLSLKLTVASHPHDDTWPKSGNQNLALAA